MKRKLTKQPPYSADELKNGHIEQQELSYRKAQSLYGIPRSTLHNHVVGNVQSCRRGPALILTLAEENMLVQWALHMADIGRGRT